MLIQNRSTSLSVRWPATRSRISCSVRKLIRPSGMIEEFSFELWRIALFWITVGLSSACGSETTFTASAVSSTTRPETMLGDTAVAVHPDDDRYKGLIGKTVTLPLVGREIPVIADEYVKSDFASGALKITPAHDPNDFEVGKRHDLEFINIFTDDARINERGGRFQGLERFEARKAVKAAVAELGLDGVLGC